MTTMTLFGDRVDIAIERLRTYEELTQGKGFYLAFSGGKDSCTIKALADMAGVKYDAHYSMTTIDPPELVYFIRDHHKDVTWHRPEKTFLQQVPKSGMPTRMARWCCEYLKEGGGEGRVVLTGVRWAESPRRSKRQMVESCYRSEGKRYLHPIIDWNDSEVWSFLRSNKVPYCHLYDEGKKRLGCMFCPMASATAKADEARRYPKYVSAFIKAFQLLKQNRESKGLTSCDRWADGEAMFKWWISNESSTKDENNGGLFE